MNTYKISYCKHPSRNNPTKCLTIKAEDKIEAIITAYDHLTQKGNVVGHVLKLSTEERKKIQDRGVQFEPYHKDGTNLLVRVEDYTVKPRGKVVEG